jgi:hypothetical protein
VSPVPRPAETRSARRRRAVSPWPLRIAIVATVVGAAIRVEQFGWRRSLWLDEALIAANIVQRSFGGLMRPLSGQQGAPVGWLWAERATVIVLGNNEYALRAVPLIAGIAALPLIYLVSRRLLGPWGSALATTLLAFSPDAVRYSVEVKQYSSDLTIALLLVLLALRGLDGGGIEEPGPLVAWGLCGAVAVWWSHPAALVLAATSAVLVASALARRSRSDLLLIALATVPWVASLGADYAVSLRRLGANSYLHNYWSAGFAPNLAGLPRWLLRVPARLASDPAGLPLPPLAAALVACGLLWIVWRRPAAGGVLVMTLLAGLAAGALGFYPVDGRMSLWLLPLAPIGLSGAAVAIVEWLQRASDHLSGMHTALHRDVSRSRPWVAGFAVVAGLVLFVAGPLRQVGDVAHDPTTWIDMRPLLQDVRPRMQPGDLVWTHSNDAAAAQYYAVSTGVQTAAVLFDAGPGRSCPGLAGIQGAAGDHRVWFVYGYQASNSIPGEQAAIVARLSTMAHLVGIIHRPQATAWLWDFGARPDRTSAAPSGLGCLGLIPVAPMRPTGLASGPFGSGGAT